MKIALAFWGLTRSLKYTIESINEKILNILKKHNIESNLDKWKHNPCKFPRF